MPHVVAVEHKGGFMFPRRCRGTGYEVSAHWHNRTSFASLYSSTLFNSDRLHKQHKNQNEIEWKHKNSVSMKAKVIPPFIRSNCFCSMHVIYCDLQREALDWEIKSRKDRMIETKAGWCPNPEVRNNRPFEIMCKFIIICNCDMQACIYVRLLLCKLVQTILPKQICTILHICAVRICDSPKERQLN